MLVPKHTAIALTRPLPKYLNKAEVEAVLENLRKKENLKNYLLVLLLWQTGARVSELLQVKVEDIDFYNSNIKIPTLKRTGGKKQQRVLPLKHQTLALISLHINQKNLKKNDKLFNFTRQQAFNIVRDAILEVFPADKGRAHPHTLRHSFAVYCIANQVPIIVVKNWMGHANINSTLIYTQILASDTKKFFDTLEF